MIRHKGRSLRFCRISACMVDRLTITIRAVWWTVVRPSKMTDANTLEKREKRNERNSILSFDRQMWIVTGE